MSSATNIKEVADLILSIDDELGLDSIDEALALVEARERKALDYMRRATWKIDALAVVVQEQLCLSCGESHSHILGTFVRESRPIDNGRQFKKLQSHRDLQQSVLGLPRIVERLETELIPGCPACWGKVSTPQLHLNFDLGEK